MVTIHYPKFTLHDLSGKILDGRLSSQLYKKLGEPTFAIVELSVNP
jgi:hypothetical protein